MSDSLPWFLSLSLTSCKDAAQFKTAFEDGQKKNADQTGSAAPPAAEPADAKPADAKTVAPAEEDTTAPTTTEAQAETKAEETAEGKEGESHAAAGEATPDDAAADAGAE